MTWWQAVSAFQEVLQLGPVRKTLPKMDVFKMSLNDFKWFELWSGLNLFIVVSWFLLVPICFQDFLFNLSQFFPQERGHGLGMFVDLGQYGSQCSVANGTVPFALGELGG